MSINIVDIILYSVLALSVISGIYKGFITSGLAMVGFGAAWYGDTHGTLEYWRPAVVLWWLSFLLNQYGDSHDQGW